MAWAEPASPTGSGLTGPKEQPSLNQQSCRARRCVAGTTLSVLGLREASGAPEDGVQHPRNSCHLCWDFLEGRRWLRSLWHSPHVPCWNPGAGLGSPGAGLGRWTINRLGLQLCVGCIKVLAMSVFGIPEHTSRHTKIK